MVLVVVIIIINNRLWLPACSGTISQPAVFDLPSATDLEKCQPPLDKLTRLLHTTLNFQPLHLGIPQTTAVTIPHQPGSKTLASDQPTRRCESFPM